SIFLVDAALSSSPILNFLSPHPVMSLESGHDHLKCRRQNFFPRMRDADDVADIVALLVDDPLGQTRETAPLERYLAAFADIDRDPNQTLLVLRDDTGAVAGTVQLTVIACLARGGTKRLQVEAVRLASHVRGLGLGTALFQWIAEFAT